MKKLIFATLAITAASFLVFRGSKTKVAVSDIPGGSSQHDKRHQWEHDKLVDPETGKIPMGIRKAELAYAATLPKNTTTQKTNGTWAWEAMGPYNLGGRTRGAAFDVTDESILIAGGVSGGIWKSTDGGASWTKTTRPDQILPISSVAQDTRAGKTDTWYAGTGELRGNSANGGDWAASKFRGDGIYKSTDNGSSWELLDSLVSNTPHEDEVYDFISRVAIDPSVDTSDVVYAAVQNGIHRSLDGGITWEVVMGSTAGNSFYTDIMVTPSGVKYATMSHTINIYGALGAANPGVWRSTTGNPGEWTNISNGTAFTASHHRVVMAYAPTDENTIMFLANNTDGIGKAGINFKGTAEYNGIYKYNYVSGDGSGAGGTWADLSENLPYGPELFDDFNSQGSYCMAIAISPADPNIVAIGGINVNISTSGFSDSLNTTHVGGYVEDTELPDFKIVENHHPDQHLLIFSNEDPNVLYSMHDGGVTRMNDVANYSTWQWLNNGYNTSQFYTVALDKQTPGSNEIIGGLQDNGTYFTRSGVATDHWTMPLSYDGAYCYIANGGQDYYMSIQLGRTVKAQIGEDGYISNYTRIDPQEANAGLYDFINPFILDPQDNNIMYMSIGNQLWRNDMLSFLPYDNVWDSITTGWTKLSGVAGGNITCFGTTETGSRTLYIGTQSGQVYKLEDPHNTDPTFTLVSGGISGTGYVTSISVDPRDDEKLLVAYSNYNVLSLNYTDNGGTDWWNVSGNLEGEPEAGLPDFLYYRGNGPSIRWATILPVDTGSVFLAGTSVGLFATDQLIKGTGLDDDTTLWVQQAPDIIANAVVSMIDYRKSDGKVVVATHGNGVYTATIDEVHDITGRKPMPDVLTKIRIYPNPTTEGINIATANGEGGYQVFDLNGKLVLFGRINSNNHHVDMRSLPNGSYVVKTNDNTETIIKH